MDPRVATWRPLVERVRAEVWPEGPPVPLLLAQVETESRGDPQAVSPAGAQGLLQLMPGTWRDLGPGGDPFDPEENVRRGLTYLHRVADGLALPSVEEVWWWALAGYVGGPGYVHRALKLARLDQEPLWWQWQTGRRWLMHRACQVRESWPDYRAIWAYVATIQRRWKEG